MNTKTQPLRRSIRSHHLITAAAFGLAGMAGCGGTGETAVVAKPAAPVESPRQIIRVPSVRFVDVTKESGIDFVHENAARGEKLLPETMGSGVAVLDYDGDGDPDLFFVNQKPWAHDKSAQGKPAPTHRLYRNDGKGKFTDATAEARFALSDFGQGVTVGDYDNDGDPDIFITAIGGCRLMRNDKGKFTDVTAEAGAKTDAVWPTSAAFFDMENDGDLDLFVCNYVAWNEQTDRGITTQIAGSGIAYDPPTQFGGTFSILLRNDGGKFVDAGADSGIQVRAGELKAPMSKALGVAPLDVDGDGLVDLAVANDTVPNFFFHNLGGGKFEEIGITAGIAFDQAGSPRGAMGTDWADFRNDGTVGLAVANFANEMIALYVASDPKSLTFVDLANVYGLGAPTQPPLKFGLFFFDYDLDGRPDLLSANGHLESDIAKVQASQTYAQPAQLFWNTGLSGRNLFALVGPDAAGVDLFRPIVGRGSAYLDFDGDGDLDVVISVNGGPAKLFRNDGGSSNHHLRIRLKGSASNRDGIGAKLTVKAGAVEQHRQHFPAKGYLSSVEPVLTFGLADAEKADRVRVVWPSGKISELKDVKADEPLTIEEPK